MIVYKDDPTNHHESDNAGTAVQTYNFGRDKSVKKDFVSNSLPQDV